MPFNPLAKFGKDVQYSLSDLQDEMNQMFQRLCQAGKRANPFSESDWIPDVDLRDEESQLVLTVEVPGVGIEDIDVSYTENILTVSGEKAMAESTSARQKRVLSERRYGTFSRSVAIPAKIDSDRIAASCKAGVLEICMPKSNVDIPKSIKVDLGD